MVPHFFSYFYESFVKVESLANFAKWDYERNKIRKFISIVDCLFLFMTRFIQMSKSITSVVFQLRCCNGLVVFYCLLPLYGLKCIVIILFKVTIACRTVIDESVSFKTLSHLCQDRIMFWHECTSKNKKKRSTHTIQRQIKICMFNNGEAKMGSRK